ncbi:hypothetical protein V8017_02350 [Stenotrophomonas rhizophila]
MRVGTGGEQLQGAVDAAAAGGVVQGGQVFVRAQRLQRLGFGGLRGEGTGGVGIEVDVATRRQRGGGGDGLQEQVRQR